MTFKTLQLCSPITTDLPEISIELKLAAYRVTLPLNQEVWHPCGTRGRCLGLISEQIKEREAYSGFSEPGSALGLPHRSVLHLYGLINRVARLLCFHSINSPTILWSSL